jgi:motility quorum-sensing regulator/GCU-specific mRNA interferase toxin
MLPGRMLQSHISQERAVTHHFQLRHLHNYPIRVIMDRRTKLRATHDLKAIQAQMTTVSAMNLTFKALKDIHAAEMSEEEALQVIQNLTMRDFHKSMPSHYNCRVWQDVYYTFWGDLPLYVKFSLAEKYIVVSFKANESEDI